MLSNGPWVYRQLKALFPFVYVPLTQPAMTSLPSIGRHRTRNNFWCEPFSLLPGVRSSTIN